MTSLIKNEAFASKIIDVSDAVRLFPRKGVIAFGGMAGTSYPKATPKALAEFVSENGSQDFGYSILCGGSATSEFDQYLAQINMQRRYPMGASSKDLRKDVNLRRFMVSDCWLFEHARWVNTGLYSRKIGVLDVAVVEINGVTEEGYVIPSLSIDASTSFIQNARKVVLELNTSRPNVEGIHDIFLPIPGQPTQIHGILEKVGTRGYKIERSKLAAVVLCDADDSETMHYSGIGQVDLQVIDNLTTFLVAEVGQDANLKSDNVTLQPGAGPIAWALANRINEVPTILGIWGEVAPTSWLPTLDGNVRGITGAVAYTLPGERKYRDILYDEFDQLKSRLLLRPYEITNNAEFISRFRHIVIQQAIEVDVYGHINVSHIGNDLYGGVGGSGDHTRSAYLTIIAVPSTTSSQQVSRIVPMVSHVDIPEHDVDVLVTEQGVADLRCLSPLERAKIIIEKCSSPKFKDRLERYYEKILDMPGHQPVDFREAANFKEDSATSKSA